MPVAAKRRNAARFERAIRLAVRCIWRTSASMPFALVLLLFFVLLMRRNHATVGAAAQDVSTGQQVRASNRDGSAARIASCGHQLAQSVQPTGGGRVQLLVLLFVSVDQPAKHNQAAKLQTAKIPKSHRGTKAGMKCASLGQ